MAVWLFIFLFFILHSTDSFAWQKDTTYSFSYGEEVMVTMDMPKMNSRHKTIIIIYVLPNGNNTAQTMGKKLLTGDDWHFDIQHIRAQTAFIRKALAGQNIVVAYVENTYKSWPQYKKVHADYAITIPKIVDTIFNIIPSHKKVLYLNGHSGGGSFIFGYLLGVKIIPAFIKRISFLDSNYGYDSSFLPKLKNWLGKKENNLNVFAYNDSMALLNGKPFVTATGGTWVRSKMMLNDLTANNNFKIVQNDSIIAYKSKHSNIFFFFKTNVERKILHTVQVERNGFIHSVLCGTQSDSRGYRYYGERAYKDYID